jgi:hypothetical protein
MASFDLEANRSALASGAWLRAANVSCEIGYFQESFLRRFRNYCGPIKIGGGPFKPSFGLSGQRSTPIAKPL